MRFSKSVRKFKSSVAVLLCLSISQKSNFVCGGKGRRSYHCGKMIQWLWGDPIIVGLNLIQSLEGDFVYVLWNIPLRSIKKVQMEHVMLSVMVLINGIRKKYNLFVVAIFGTSNFHSRCRRLL